MGDPYKKAQAGQPLSIPAALFNDTIDTVRAFKAGRQSGPRPGNPGAGIQPGQVWVKNTTNSNLDRFAVLGISDALISPADNPGAFVERPMVQGVAPTADHVGGRFVVVVEPIAAGKVGVAAAGGITILKLNVASEGHWHADAKDGTTAALASAESGPVRVLWKQSGTGDGKWAIGRFAGGGDRNVVVQVTGPHPGGGKYAGVVLPGRPAGDVSVATGLTAADYGGTAGAAACIVLHAWEAGRSSHCLPTGAILPGVVTSTNADGTKVVTVGFALPPLTSQYQGWFAVDPTLAPVSTFTRVHK